MDVVLASRNAHKIKELQAILSEKIPSLTLHSLDDVGFEGDIDENGTTYEENALIKARAAMEASGGRWAGLGDDSGLSVDVLDGAPGVYSARYAGSHGDTRANNELLLKNLEGVPVEARTARFVCCMACVLPSGESIVRRGEVEGLILDEYRGTDGFGYDPLFYIPSLGKTFAELSAEDKNAISHRGRAIEALSVALAEQN